MPTIEPLRSVMDGPLALMKSADRPPIKASHFAALGTGRVLSIPGATGLPLNHDGAFTVKRDRVKDGAVWLQAENPAFADIRVSNGQSFEVRGIITRSIRML